MDLRSLRAAIEVADQGSFGEAAASLDLSISSVSLQISALEDHLGVLLFDRKTRPPAITEVGEAFVSQARKLVTDWDELSGSFGLKHQQRVIKIGAVHTSVVQLLPSALKKLQRQNPELQVRLSTGLSHELEQEVVKSRLDCALTTLSDVIPAELTSVLLHHEPMTVIAHKSAVGKSWRELLQLNPYVRFAQHAQVARLVETELEKQNVLVKSTMEIDTLDGVVALVNNGLGVSIIPGGYKKSPLSPAIRSIPFSDPVMHRKLGIVMRRDSHKMNLINSLVSILQNAD